MPERIARSRLASVRDANSRAPRQAVAVTSVKMVEKRVGGEVVIGQAAMGGI